MKNLLIAIAALMLVMGMATACASPTEEPAAPAEVEQPETEKEAEAMPTEAEEVAEEPVEGATAEDIVGIVWQWLGTTTPVESIAVEDPTKYTLVFGEDGLVAVQADCNSAMGEYTVDGGTISIALGMSTMAECGPESHYDAFMTSLGAAAIYFLDAGDLYIDLMMDSGTMRFANGGMADEMAAVEGEDEAVAEDEGDVLADFEADAVDAIDPTMEVFLRALYTLPDGTVDSPSDTDETDDNHALALVQQMVASGDLDADGDEDTAALLVDLADELGPVLFLAALANEDGTPTNTSTVTLEKYAGVSDVRVENGEIKVDAWLPTADGTGYEMVTLTFKLTDGQIEETQPPAPQPAPTAVPTDAPKPAPATVGITVRPQNKDVKPGDKVDIYVNATNNPNIVKLDWYLDGKVQGDGWTAPTAEGVPYVHHTFTWRQATSGKHYIQVKATDKFGTEGWSENKKYTVNP